MDKNGLYIHIPFCKSKCKYCDFYSRADINISLYLSCFEKYCEYFQNKLTNKLFDTVYIGGGTPSLLGNTGIAKLMNIINKYFIVDNNSEITMEVNPESVTKQLIESAVISGVNRISIGLQSADNKTLQLIGRLHSLEDFDTAYDTIGEYGIKNISVDMMYALPNTKIANVKNTVEYILSKNPEHISAYALTLEENTPLYKMKDRLTFPSEDEQFEMYDYIINKFSDNGYKQYEISNFAKKEKYAKHNMKYWMGVNYLGIGPSAHSMIKGYRFHINNDLKKFYNFSNNPYNNIVLDEVLSKEDKLIEYIMLSLRTKKGLNFNHLKESVSEDIFNKIINIARKYCSYGYADIENNNMILNTKGMWMSNSIISDMIAEM